MSHGNRRRHFAKGPSGKSPTRQDASMGLQTSEIVNAHRPGMPIASPLGIGGAPRMPRFMDMPADSFHEMMNKVADVQSAFASLPARLKGKFGNNPYQMMRWVQNPDNRKEALKMGLVVPTPEEATELAKEAAKARRTEQVEIFREALKSDPEAQPEYRAKPEYGAKPQEGGTK